MIERNVMVPMRDGVRLATDVYLPARDGQILPGRFPTLFARTPYGKTPWPIIPGAEPPDAVRARITGERLGFETHRVIARNTVYHDAAQPSHVSLPLLPATHTEGH